MTTSGLYDLRAFFKNVGSLAAGSLTSAPSERNDRSEKTNIIDQAITPITGPPLEVTGFVDGIQSALAITYRHHRPVYLTFQAAGAVGARGKLVGLKENLCLLASVQDQPWVEKTNIDPPIPLHILEATHPAEVERQAYETVGVLRDQQEHQLVKDLIEKGTGALILDGSLRRRPFHQDLYAVVKDTQSTQYLPDETTQLHNLPQGHRSAIFTTPPPFDTSPTIYSCYLRLHDATRQAWHHGLVRLEAYRPQALMPLAARALAERQGPRSGDGRWDRHLAAVAMAEEVIRSRRPHIFH